MPSKIKIKRPEDFDLALTAKGHGWYDLAPFSYDEDKRSLRYVFRDNSGRKVSPGSITDNNGFIEISLSNSKLPAASVVRDVRHILRLDDEFSDFYSKARLYEGTKWAAAKKAGRLLRSPTVFEDLIKTLCTTNCSWALTKSMVNNLVQKLGNGTDRHGRSFPTAETMAKMDENFYRNEIRAGYRSPFFVLISRSVAEGNLDPESWLDRDIPSADLRKHIKEVKGIGDYAADNLLKLLGRYDGLALDSWLRKHFFEKHNRGKVCSDKKIARHYKDFGEWCGLAIWCDMTEAWFPGDPAAT